MVAAPASPALSASQPARLGALGDERTARVGNVLYRVDHRAYPSIAIVEGPCATAVGEGAMAVQFAHGRVAGLAHAQR
jgi:hypothetical protein